MESLHVLKPYVIALVDSNSLPDEMELEMCNAWHMEDGQMDPIKAIDPGLVYALF